MLHKIVQESVSQIGEKIQDKYNTGDNWLYRLNKKEDAYYSCGSELSSFVKKELISSQISLLEAELERKKGMMKEIEAGTKMVFSPQDKKQSVWDFIQEDIQYLEGELEACKKLLNN